MASDNRGIPSCPSLTACPTTEQCSAHGRHVCTDAERAPLLRASSPPNRSDRPRTVPPIDPRCRCCRVRNRRKFPRREKSKRGPIAIASRWPVCGPKVSLSLSLSPNLKQKLLVVCRECSDDDESYDGESCDGADGADGEDHA